MKKVDEVEAESRYEQIMSLLVDQGPLSTHRIMRKLGINGTGQVLNRLRILEVRGRVERIPGEREGWTLWKAL